MALQPTHELHGRRKGRNFGVAALLLIFVGIVFMLTVTKIQRGEGASLEGLDHTVRSERAWEAEPAAEAPAAEGAGQ